MKQEFINFVKKLMDANPELTAEIITEDIKDYLIALEGVAVEKPALTENGKIILQYLQNHSETKFWKAKDLSDQLEIQSRSVSGTLRKLVNDGFCEKIGQNPIIYNLTEKGKTYIIENEGDNN